MSVKRALITGITGFVAPHLAEFLLSQGDIEVHGMYRRTEQLHKLSHLKDRIILHQGDLTNRPSLDEVINQAKPDFVFHLAAQSNVSDSWKEPEVTMQTNATGTLHLLEAIRASSTDPVIQIACSSEQYGLVNYETLPLNEACAFHPLSPYAVSKISCDLLGYQYFKSYGMRIVRTRAFNHTGPGQTDRYVCSSFAKKIAEIEKDLKSPILMVGNLEAIRDFSDVRDIVRAYFLSVTKGIPGECYILASQTGRTIQSILDELLAMSKTPIRVETDPNLLRPSDIPATYGNATKFRETTGWRPEIAFEKTLSDLLEYWRVRV